MSDNKAGSIGWVDLTVDHAEDLKDFYQQVTGWQPEAVSMGDYNDFNMCNDAGPVAGVCHRRGSNAQIPPQWMIYIVVSDLAQSVQRCLDLGGQVLVQREGSSFAIIEDPAGAVCALYQA